MPPGSQDEYFALLYGFMTSGLVGSDVALPFAIDP